MRTAVLYARVSTEQQSAQMQLDELYDYAKRKGWDIVGTYVDKCSGAKDDRPELKKLMQYIRHGNDCDVVLVYRFDRMARSMRHLVTVLEEFRDNSIDFVSIHEQVDTSTAAGRMVFGIFASIAEFERELIRERVKSGMASARNKGVRLGAPPRHKHKGERARVMLENGLSRCQVAKSLKMSERTLGRILKQSASDASHDSSTQQPPPDPQSGSEGLSLQQSAHSPSQSEPDTLQDQTPRIP